MAKKSATRRIITIIVALLVLLVVLGVVGTMTGIFGGGDQATEVETARAEIRGITQVVTASGKVQPEVEVKISPDVSGEIIDLRVKEGDEVKQGALLVRIKPDFYEAQVEQRAAGVSQAQAARAQRKADLLKAEIDFNRQKGLYDKGVISESDFQTAQTQYEVARAAFEAADFAVQSAEAAQREAAEQLAKTRIYAPMNGTVSKLDVEFGERVVGTSQMAGTEMMRVAQLAQMELEVDVNENDVVNVSESDTASIEIDAYPNRTFRGVVTEIANSARISGEGTQEQVTNFPVKIRIGEAQLAGEPDAAATPPGDDVPLPSAVQAPVFRPGMSGTVDIYTQTVSQAVAVPIQAVTVRDFNKVKPGGEAPQEGGDAARDGDAPPAAGPEADTTQLAYSGVVQEDLRRVVFLVEDGTAHMVEVETGISDDTFIEIRSGLSGGETVIIGPYRVVSRTLAPGDKVDVQDPNRRAGRGPFAAAR